MKRGKFSMFAVKEYFVLFNVALLLVQCQLSLSISEHPLLIIISFDGFRYDYLSKTDTPNFDKFVSDGVRAPWIEARFITKTFPNHFSIATGLYEENHGMVANNFYDPVLNDTFKLGDLDPKWWDTGAVPLWVTNQLSAPNRYSGGMMWPGTAAKIRNQTAFHFVDYSGKVSWTKRVDDAIQWLTDKDKPANCIFMYFEQPDAVGHKFGPDSPEVAVQIRRADNITGYLIEKLTEIELYDKVNIIITSDHGMANVPKENYINMSAIVDAKLYRSFGSSPVWGILPLEKEDEVYNAFHEASKTLNFTVYKKEDIPEVYHYKNNRRIMPILLVSNENWDIAPWEDMEVGPVHGTHGYNNSISSMRPFFVAHGPDFKKGFLSKPFRNIDIYPLMCHLLGLKAMPNNGSLENIRDLLLYPPTEDIDGTVLIVVGVLLGFCLLVAVVAVIGLYRRSKKPTTPPTTLHAVDVPPGARKTNEPADTEEQRSLMASPLDDDT